MRRLIGLGVVALLFTTVGFVLGRTDIGAPVRELADRAQEAAVDEVVRRGSLDTRTRVLLENPKMMTALAEGGSFGGEFSAEVAQNMFGRTPEAIAAARKKMKVVEVAPRTWLIRLPIVNAVLFETDAGLVLVDTGMAPAGPAIVDAIRSVSQAPLHTVIYTHGHVDHAYGTWALLEAGWQPEVVAHAKLVKRFERYLRLRGSIAQYMSQKEEQMPASREDLVWPTRTFEGSRLELEIGGETFELHHAPGETDDQLWVWLPGRRAIASADYYQGFLPNAGNGKRVQRYLEEWSEALIAMADLQPAVLLPAHGEALDDPAEIQENLRAHAEVLRYVVDHTIAGLNAGLRKDEIFGSLELPPHLANHPTLKIQYVTPQDLSKMVIRRYTGWWNDIPSNWTPASQQAQGRLIVELAGGLGEVDRRARALAEGGELDLAAHLADWAFYAEPSDATAQDLVIDVYRQRIEDPRTNTQERLAYLDAMVAAREAQLASAGR
jgi:alkyl sulfatase BDS1-like metallo-beta-lactamase superfamily hydrolase